MNTPDSKWKNRALLLLAGVVLFRMVYAWIYPLNLSGDEAYYWDWGRHLDWGYYSKPPMIGWLMGLLRFLHVDHDAGIRMTSALIGTGTLGLIYAVAAKLFSPRTGFWALCISVATIGNAALNICMTTDAMLTLCWCGALYSFWRLMETPSRRWSSLLILCIGFGSLSKQMMFIFFPMAVIFLLCTPSNRALLKRPILWVSGLVPLLFSLPSLYWNSQHEWITFQHTSNHLGGDPFSLGEALIQVAEFLGSQLGLMTPLTFILLVTVFVLLMRRRVTFSPAMRYLFFFSAPPLILFLLFAFHRSINPNWPLVFDLTGLILMTGVCCECGGLLFVWLRRSLITGAILTALFYTVMVVVPLSGIDLTRLAPLRQVSGWEAYGKAVADVQQTLPDPENTMLIIVGHRYHTAALAFYHPDRPTVYRWDDHPGIDNQYDLWPGPNQPGQNALIVVYGDQPVPRKLADHFDGITKLSSLEIPPGAHKPKRYALYYGKGWKTNGAE
jgi:4-amino-4-deoxy-L-arabinose transferase-like glycosyltransferase